MNTAEIAGLLEASFRLWNVRAEAAAVSGPPPAWVVRAAGRDEIIVSRVCAPSGVGRWRVAPRSPRGAAVPDATEHPSVPALLKRIRAHLDADWTPGRAIIGMRGPDGASR
jgi:hypothetical protein